MSYVLSNVIFPSTEWKSYTDLFVRSKSEKMVCINGHYTHAKLYKFNTWMNTFAAKKYYKYCDLGELYLKLHIKGSYHLQIVGSSRNHVYGRLDTTLVDTFITSEAVEVCVPDAKDYDGVYFIIFGTKNSPIEIISAAWVTDKAPLRNNRLAIVSCTFKREKYINKTIAVYEQFIRDNQELKNRIKLFVVDNGKTLDLKMTNETTQIYHNKNAGGSGGFTRGLMEVCYLNDEAEKSNPYTRVLFMDDDVEVLPESFYRTLVVSDYLRDEWKDSFINGAMINSERKNALFENLAFQHRLFVSRNSQDIDLFDYNSVLLANERPDSVFCKPDVKVFSGWWYCCFPVGKNAKNDLPLPLFIRGDDVEWGWRNHGKHHIALNGICVWHAPFEWRVPLVTDMYYLPRNMFMVNIIHTENFQDKFARYFTDMFFYRLKVYDYVAIEIFLSTMDDILKGSIVFREDSEKQLQRLTQISKKIQYFDADNAELAQAKEYCPGSGFKRKLLHKLTGWGLYCPNFLFSKTSISLEWLPPVDNFRLRKEIKVYNLLTGKYCVRKFDRKLMLFYKKEFYSRLRKIKSRYNDLKKDYDKAFSEFTSSAFWEKYLEIR